MPITVSCNLCGSPDAAPQPTRTRLLQLPAPYMLVCCKCCGLSYLSPRPAPAELPALYSRSTYWSAANIAGFSRREVFDHARLQRLEQFHPARGSLLGIGCLEGGYFLANARAGGWQVLAVEFVQTLLDHLADPLDLPVVAAPLWALETLAPRRFQVVYSNILEHVPDPRQTLRSCRELLAPGGVLMLEVPNQLEVLKESFKQALYALVGDRLLPYLYGEVEPHFHVSYFTPATLRSLLAAEGFEVLALRTYLPRHPVYLSNPRARRLQELLYRAGGWLDRGPSIEVVARPAST